MKSVDIITQNVNSYASVDICCFSLYRIHFSFSQQDLDFPIIPFLSPTQ